MNTSLAFKICMLIHNVRMKQPSSCFEMNPFITVDDYSSFSKGL